MHWIRKGLLSVSCVLLFGSLAAAQQGNGAISPDGKFRAELAGQAVRVVDAATGKTLLTMRGHTNTVQAAAFSPDGRGLASGGKDSVICLWDLASGKLLAKVRVGAAVNNLTYTDKGKTLTARLADNATQTIDAATGKTISKQ